jgi:hypothetical protein
MIRSIGWSMSTLRASSAPGVPAPRTDCPEATAACSDPRAATSGRRSPHAGLPDGRTRPARPRPRGSGPGKPAAAPSSRRSPAPRWPAPGRPGPARASGPCPSKEPLSASFRHWPSDADCRRRCRAHRWLPIRLPRPKTFHSPKHPSEPVAVSWLRLRIRRCPKRASRPAR